MKALDILVLEDEESIITLLTAFFRRFGCAGTFTRDGADTIAEYRKALDCHRRFDAVILDLSIPGGMGGRETIAKLREIDPGVVAAVSTGCSQDAVLAEYKGLGFRTYLIKPYTLAAITAVLSQLSEAPPTPLP